jgi:hypothetical protein
LGAHRYASALVLSIKNTRVAILFGKEGVMQRNEPSKSVVRPGGAQLRAFADRLSSFHPADVRHILWAIAEFGYQFYPMIDARSHVPVEFVDQLHEATDSAHALGVLFPEITELGFQQFMADVAKVFDLEIGYFTSACDGGMNPDAYLVLVELRRLQNSLGFNNAAAPLPEGSEHWYLYRALSSHLAIVAGICIAALIWVLVSDHMPLWQVLAAVVLVVAFGGLAFRLGQKAATGVQTSAT